MAFLDELDELDFGSMLGGSIRATPGHFAASQDIENLAATGAISAQEADFRKARNLIGTGFSPPLAAAGAYPYQIGQEVFRDVRDQGISGIGSGLRRGAQAGWDNLRGIGAGIYDRIHGSPVPSGINQAQLDQEMSISNPNARLLASVGPLPSGMLGTVGQWNPAQQPVQTPQFGPLNIPGRMPAPTQQPIYDRGPQMQPPVPPQFPSLPPQMIFDPPPQVRPPMPPPPPNIGDVWEPAPPPRPPEITIVDPPRRPEPPKKKKVKKPMKETRAEKTGYDKGPGGSRVPPTRPGRTQEGRGPKGPRTITGIARSHRGRGDR